LLSFLATQVVCLIDLQSVVLGQTLVLKEWRKVPTWKFVYMCEEIFWVLKNILDRSIGKNDMGI
jgi:hypothetical protein